MALEDWKVTEAGERRGGQGVVRKVIHRQNGRVGALKQLHGEAPKQRERRYRFLVEVGGLRVLNGHGVPRVIEANEQSWEDKNVELYLVMEFIEGPTLQDAVQAKFPTVDEAVATTSRLLSVLDEGHKLPLHHHDLKPDNLILRNGDWNDPVLVDLGTAWKGDEEAGYKTPDGKELGNRFLRLPEFAPGGEHHDARSDVAMAAGLMFFMLSGRAPRTLVDHEGKHPHEREPSSIRADVRADERWPGLRSILRVAFQHRIEARFRDAGEFAGRLAALDSEKGKVADELDQEIARLQENLNSALSRQRAEAGPTMKAASAELYQELTQLWDQAGLMQGGQHPTFMRAGATTEFYCVVSRLDHAQPNVLFRHIVELIDERLQARCSNDDGQAEVYHEGPAADDEGLRAAMLENARRIAGGVIRRLIEKLEPVADLKPFLGR